jgi:hypothetical protein
MRSITVLALVIVGLMAISGIAVSKIVINEVELNPGCDTRNCFQFFELYNTGTGDEFFDLDGWTISSTNSGATIDLTGHAIFPGHIFGMGLGERFEQNDECLILRNREGIEVDRTPILSDNSDNNYTWSRIPDGAANWRFVRGTWYSKNTPQYS